MPTGQVVVAEEDVDAADRITSGTYYSIFSDTNDFMLNLHSFHFSGAGMLGATPPWPHYINVVPLRTSYLVRYNLTPQTCQMDVCGCIYGWMVRIECHCRLSETDSILEGIWKLTVNGQLSLSRHNLNTSLFFHMSSFNLF